jgi:hypothetical protein
VPHVGGEGRSVHEDERRPGAANTITNRLTPELVRPVKGDGSGGTHAPGRRLVRPLRGAAVFGSGNRTAWRR